MTASASVSGFHDVATLGDAAVGDETDVFLFRGGAADVERGELRDADARDNARGADGAGALADLDASAPASARNATPAALVTLPAMIVRCLNSSRTSRTTSPTLAVWPCAVETATQSTCSSASRPTCRSRIVVAIESAIRAARGGERGAGDEAKLGIARGLATGLRLAHEALDVGAGDEAAKAVRRIDDEHFVMPMLSEKNLSAYLIGSLPRSRSLTVMSLARGVIASVTFFAR